MHVYEKGHSHFYTPWQMMVAFKNGDEKQSRLRLNRNAAAIEMDLYRRLHITRSGKLPLRCFDGSNMMNYQMPPKVAETTYCQKEETPLECHEYPGLDKLGNNDAASLLKNQQSFPRDDQIGRGQVSDSILKFVTQYF